MDTRGILVKLMRQFQKLFKHRLQKFCPPIHKFSVHSYWINSYVELFWQALKTLFALSHSKCRTSQSSKIIRIVIFLERELVEDELVQLYLWVSWLCCLRSHALKDSNERIIKNLNRRILSRIIPYVALLIYITPFYDYALCVRSHAFYLSLGSFKKCALRPEFLCSVTLKI